MIAHWGLWFSAVETQLSPQQAVALTWSRYNTQKNVWLIAGGFRHQSRRTQNLCLCVHSKAPQPLSSMCSCKHLCYLYTCVFAHSQCIGFVHVNPSVFMPEGQCVKTAPTKLCVSKPGYLGSLKMWHLLLQRRILSSEMSAKVMWLQWDLGFLIREHHFWSLGDCRMNSFWEFYQARYKWICDNYLKRFT